MNSVACIGDIAVDYYVTLARRHVGGISFNVAWNLRDQGVDARVFSLIGNDQDGSDLLSALSRRHFPTKDLRTRNGETAQQRILIQSNGERIFNGYRTGVLQSLSLHDLPSGALSQFEALHVPLSDGLEKLFESVAREITGVIKIADLSIDGPTPGRLSESVRRYAQFFDLIFVGGNSECIGEVAAVARTNPNTTLVLTLGSKGAVSFRGQAFYEQAALPLSTVVDTTGCGDGFQGAFIAHWLSQRDNLSGALDAGIQQGAKLASFFGSTPCVIDAPEDGYSC